MSRHLRVAVFVAAVATTGHTDRACASCEHRLEGTWKSDGAATMVFVREKAKLPKKTEEFLAATTSHLRLTFAKGALHTVMPDVALPPSFEQPTFFGSDFRKPYRIVFCSQSSIIWLSENPYTRVEEATTFHFVDPDTAWIYSGSTEPGIPDLHAREYFKRITP